jgi:hypothetical protein
MTEPKPESKPTEEPKAEAPAPAAPAIEKAAIPVIDPSADHIGKRIAKKFGKKNFFGAIKEKWLDGADSASRWHVKYDDGDEEDFNEKELDNALKRYEKSKRFDFKIFPKKPRAPSKKRKIEPPPPRTNKYPKRGTAKTD